MQRIREVTFHHVVGCKLNVTRACNPCSAITDICFSPFCSTTTITTTTYTNWTAIVQEHEAQARANEEKEARFWRTTRSRRRRAGCARKGGQCGEGRRGSRSIRTACTRCRARGAAAVAVGVPAARLRRLTKKMGLARTRGTRAGIGGRLARVEAATADLQLGLGKLRTTVEEMATAAADCRHEVNFNFHL